MSYKSKYTFLSEASSSYVPSSVKWSGQNLQNQFNNIPDSVLWIDQKVSMVGTTFNCLSGSLQEKILTTNVTMSISNAVSGMYYTLIKKGSYLMAIPTGSYSSSGNATGLDTTVITFMYDGTNYYFNFSAYNIV